MLPAESMKNRKYTGDYAKNTRYIHLQKILKTAVCTLFTVLCSFILLQTFQEPAFHIMADLL